MGWNPNLSHFSGSAFLISPEDDRATTKESIQLTCSREACDGEQLGAPRLGVEAYIDLLSRFAYEAIGNSFAVLKVSGRYAPISVFVPRAEAPRQKDLSITD